jgi:hypothetical protein
VGEAPQSEQYQNRHGSADNADAQQRESTAEPRKRKVSRLVKLLIPTAPDPLDITEPFIAFVSPTLTLLTKHYRPLNIWAT